MLILFAKLKISQVYLMMNVPISNVAPLKNLPLISLIYSVFLKGVFEMVLVSLNTRILIDAMLVN